MERALLESALFAHLSVADLRSAMSQASEWIGLDGKWRGQTRSDDDRFGPCIWGWMADHHHVTCAICHRQFMWTGSERHLDLGHFSQLALPRHKPVAFIYGERREALTPFCRDCGSVIGKAGTTFRHVNEAQFMLGLSELLRSREVKERVKEFSGQKLRIHPTSAPEGADENGNLFICDDGSIW
jgi:hypothetical protein